MTDRSKEFNEFFQETYTLFEITAKYAKYLEFLGGKVEVHYINELRSVLFHLYNYLDPSCDKTEKLEENFYGAREHLYRAYYDVFSLICVMGMKRISEYDQQFSHTILYKVCPEYFGIARKINNLKPIIAKIQNTKDVPTEEVPTRRLEATALDTELSIFEKIERNEGYVTAIKNWVDELDLKRKLLVEEQEAKDQEDMELKIAADDRVRDHELQMQTIAFEREKLAKETNRYKVNAWSSIIVPIAVAILAAVITYYIVVPRTIALQNEATKHVSTH